MNYINSKNELYDKCENMEELYDRYYLYLLSQYELTVLKNQELKKKLEVGEEQYNDVVEEKEKLKIENEILDEKLGKYIDQKQEWIELLDMFKNQQKEFIEYITSYIKLLNDKPDLVELSQKDILEEILSKYKEIMEVKE